MLNNKDPLIGAVQEVMKKNQAERDAVRLVNEKFGVTDRRALPREQQANWDAAYKTVLSEGVEALDEITPELVARAAKKAEINANAAADDNLHVQAKAYGDQAERLWDKAEEKREKERRKKDIAGLSSGKKRAYQKRYGKLKEEALDEKLVGNQPKIDVASSTGEKKSDGKLTKHDFEHLRSMKEEGDPSKAIRGDVVTGGSSVTTVPKPAPKPTIGEPDQKALANKIKSVMEEWTKKQHDKQKKIADAIARKNPGMPKSRKFAIAGGAVNKMKKKLEEAQTVAGGKGDLPSGISAAPKPQTVASGKAPISPEATSKNNNAPGPSFERTGRGTAPSAPQAPTRSLTTNDGDKPSITQTMQRGAEQDKVEFGKRPSAVAPQGAGAAGQQVGKPMPTTRPDDLGKAGVPGTGGKLAAKPPMPTVKPANAKVNSVKTAAKVKAVRKQPNAGAAQRQGVASRPVRGNTALSRIAKMRADRQRNKNNDVGRP